MFRRKQDEVAVLEQTIRTRNEMQRAAGVELAATCHICLKTKFADGVGHSCHYCRVRCCARCGGKVTLRSNKVIMKINVNISITTKAVLFATEAYIIVYINLIGF